MGTYTPNYNLYMPSIGEQGWGDLVSNNFENLDTNLNDLQNQINTINTQIDTINTNIGDGTRILSISSPPIINSENFGKYASYDENNVYIAQFCYATIESILKSHSCRLMIISVNGDLIISGNIDTYPTTLQSETPPGTPETNTYNKIISNSIDTISFTYTKSNNTATLLVSKSDLKSFLDAVIYNSVNYTVSIPAATAAGGTTTNGTAGTAENTCNGGGGGSFNAYTGGTGCIFGQYSGGISGNYDGYGYGSSASNKYRCGLIFVVYGNLTITGTITQNGGNGTNSIGGYGGGAYCAGGGGAPVFIYYTGSYVNNGTINVNGGNAVNSGYGTKGGAGGIKVTKISI